MVNVRLPSAGPSTRRDTLRDRADPQGGIPLEPASLGYRTLGRLLLALGALSLLIASTGAATPSDRSPFSLRLPDGQRCLVIGREDGRAQPLLFIFQGSIESALAEPLYTEVGRLLARQGVLSVVLDAPAHGAALRPGEPGELDGWAHSVSHGLPFLQPFLARATSTLDHLITDGWADSQRVAACGTSRGGFLAFHFAAHDRRIRAVAGIAPVTDLAALREFSRLGPISGTQDLALVRLAPRLAGTPAWISIGNHDTRVGTEPAIAFARALVSAAETAGPPATGIPVELFVHSAPGHRSSLDDHRRLSRWLRGPLGLPVVDE